MKSLVRLFLNVALVAFVSSTAQAQDVCSKPITKAIMTVSNLKCHKAHEIALIVNRLTKQHGIDWKLLVALIAQESSFRVNAMNCAKGYQQVAAQVWELVDKTELCQDFGPTQINYKNVKVLQLDINRLLSDWEYSLTETLKILTKLKRTYQEKDPIFWWARYHSSTKDLKEAYFKRVMLIYTQIPS